MLTSNSTPTPITNTYPPVKIELEPPQDGDPCAYAAHLFPIAFINAINHAASTMIDDWVAANAPPEILALVSAQNCLDEYRATIAAGHPIPAFLHSNLLTMLPATLGKVSDRITYEVDGALYGGEQ